LQIAQNYVRSKHSHTWAKPRAPGNEGAAAAQTLGISRGTTRCNITTPEKGGNKRDQTTKGRETRLISTGYRASFIILFQETENGGKGKVALLGVARSKAVCSPLFHPLHASKHFDSGCMHVPRGITRNDGPYVRSCSLPRRVVTPPPSGASCCLRECPPAFSPQHWTIEYLHQDSQGVRLLVIFPDRLH
jgi:hypothetical protein